MQTFFLFSEQLIRHKVIVAQPSFHQISFLKISDAQKQMVLPTYIAKTALQPTLTAQTPIILVRQTK